MIEVEMIKINKVLVVDDDDVDRMALCRLLRAINPGIVIKEADSAVNALGQFHEQEYDCIFLDFFMPDGDGLSVLRQMRADDSLVPVIMLTGQGDEQLAVSMIQAGASDYLPKGKLNREALFHSLRNVCRLHQAESERRSIEESLRQSNKKIVDILECISDAFFAIDSTSRFTYLNAQAESLLQESRQVLLGQVIWDCLPEATSWLQDAIGKAIKQGGAISAEGFYEPRNMWFEANVYPGHDGVTVYFRDITERKQIEERLSYLANYDALTGLPNRSLLMDRIGQALSRAPWQGRVVALMFCDLDRFKIVNDTLGHAVGDQLLKCVAERLESCLRAGDTVARIGGDEFVILLTDMAGKNDAGMVAQKIVKVVSAPLEILGHEIYVTTSIGVSTFPDHGHDPQTLLKNADFAMYRAKEGGKNTFQYFEPELAAKQQTRLSLEGKLRRALEQREFVLHYQPIVELEQGRIVGCESLIRWQHPSLGLVSPADFLPLAEETGIIVHIGEWAIRAACEQHRQWVDEFGLMRMAVNLSNRQFQQENLVGLIMSILSDVGLPHESLEIELTEDIIMKDASHAVRTLEQMQELGVQLSIDDFGTGYSSLGQLKCFPIDTLKIDRSFIKDITTNPDDIAIVRAIVAMAHQLRIKVVAEGVESEQQMEAVKECRCNYLQGYWYSRPLPAEAFTDFLRKNRLLS